MPPNTSAMCILLFNKNGNSIIQDESGARYFRAADAVTIEQVFPVVFCLSTVDH